MHTALTIAGSDPSGGAGIQADIKTMTAHGVYAMAAVTALTAQNTTGVFDVVEVTPKFMEEQLESILSDIPPEAVKTGMVPSEPLVHVIAEELRKYGAKNIVVDPVMVSTSGHRLMDPDSIDVFAEELFPLATLVTPNIPEAESLTEISISSKPDMERAARVIAGSFGCAVLLKGGHMRGDADDLLLTAAGDMKWFYGKRIDNPNTHGTGCTLSAAIASNFAKGLPLFDAVREAKRYLSDAIAVGLDLGAGRGPLNHCVNMKN
ncbi:MAG: bifunctional hydroxymethylpyrimidine kinase/phosphomethylpyrimidine kinase [Clostridiales bacterium]|nr:bifunctional hydroxymethylpyrimidine kinase/phosphomethylpyrimidine kinase [Clostridiales bacterium]